MAYLSEDPFTGEKYDPFEDLVHIAYNVVFLSWFALSAVLMMIVQVFSTSKEQFQRILHHYITVSTMPILPVTHTGYTEPTTPTIIVANHSSLVDFLLLNYIPCPFGKVMSSNVVNRLWFLRPIVQGTPSVVVEYGNAERVIQEAAEFMRTKGSLLIFPEGDMNSTDRAVLPFRRGAFELARRTGYRIQPVVIKGSKVFARYKPNKCTMLNPTALPLEFKWLPSYTVSPDADALEEAGRLERVFEKELTEAVF